MSATESAELRWAIRAFYHRRRVNYHFQLARRALDGKRCLSSECYTVNTTIVRFHIGKNWTEPWLGAVSSNNEVEIFQLLPVITDDVPAVAIARRDG